MSHPLLSHPFIAEQIEDAIAPFLGRVSDDELQWMREQLAAHLDENEHASTLVKGAYPRTVDTSGEQLAPFIDDVADEFEVSGTDD